MNPENPGDPDLGRSGDNAELADDQQVEVGLMNSSASVVVAEDSDARIQSEEPNLALQTKRLMASKKRALTMIIGSLQSKMQSSERVSRTKILMDRQALEERLEDLKTIVAEYVERGVDEDEHERVDFYLLTEEQRVRDVLADVQDHLEERQNETVTSFGSSQPEMKEFQQEILKGKLDGQVLSIPVDNSARDTDTQIHNVPKENSGSSVFARVKGGSSNWMTQPQVTVVGMTSKGGKSSIKTEMPVFSGRPLEFTNWSNMFYSLVHATNKAAAEKMGLLRASISTECSKVIEGFDNSEEHYHQALSVLYRRYGNERVVRRAHLQAIQDIPAVRSGEPASFCEFADLLQGHLRVVTGLLPKGDGLLLTLLEDLEKKLGHDQFMRWRDYAENHVEEERVYQFGEWALSQADKYREHNMDKDWKANREGHRPKGSIGSWNNVGASLFQACRICKGTHKEKACELFKSAQPRTRWDLSRKHGLCFLCLEVGHRVTDCPRKEQGLCSREGCNGSHHTWLHFDDTRVNVDQASLDDQGRRDLQIVEARVNSVNVEARLGIIPVVCSFGANKMTISALIDEGSDTTIVSERVRKELKIPKPKQRTIVMNLVSEKTKCNSGTINFNVAAPSSQWLGHPLEAITLPEVCKNLRGYSWKELKLKVAHLSDLPLEEMETPVELLIGADNLHLIRPLECRGGTKNEPYAMRCELGWVVRGRVPTSIQNKNVDLAINCAEVNGRELENLVRDFFTSERFGSEQESTDTQVWSQEDAYAMKLIEDGTKKLVGEPGYEASLPWKSGLRPKNDPDAAIKRFRALQRKMARQPEYAEDYNKAITVYIEEGYARKITNPEELNHPNQRWLPHHGVYKDRNSHKVRVVFDSAAKFHGLSLNDCLYTGPALQGEVLPLLIGFREYEVGVTADISAMYSRIRMNQDDARYHRFLWVNKNGNQELFEMTGVVFGDAPSPCQAIHTLMRTVEEHGSPEMLDLVEKRFYMDDYLNSYSSEEEALKVCKELQEVLRPGNFHLGKWLSNSQHLRDSMNLKANPPAIPASIPLNEREGQVLGVVWDVQGDRLGFALKNLSRTEVLFTRRGLLAKLSGIYDPSGWAAPFTVTGKIMMQELAKMAKGWDELLSVKDRANWEKWLEAATLLQNVWIPRCLLPNEVQNAQLHVFCDASVEAFAAVAYLRITFTSGEVDVRIVLAKTRVAPVKPISIAKLELNGALLGARMARFLENTFREPVGRKILWTDSMSVLGWIQAKASYYKTFVSNRVGEIQTLSVPSNWRHVPGHSNPADLATRSILSTPTIPDLWLKGPCFLRDEEKSWPVKKNAPPISEEMKNECNAMVALVKAPSDKNCDWFQGISSLSEAQDKVRQEAPTIANQMQWLIRESQSRSFPQDIFNLQNGLPLGKGSRVVTLSPYLDDEGMMRVGGRIDKAEAPYELRHPILLDPNDVLTMLIMEDLHTNSNHPGPNHSLVLLRQCYHVLRGREAVKRVISKCLFCKRRSARPSCQKMADLPNERLAVPAPPFTHSSVDLFGPYQVVVSRNRCEKRWGVIFTCLTTRAVHLEVVQSLSEDDFLSTLRIFENLRGRPQTIYSDNGTNFVATARVLRERQIPIKWTFQVPAAPHWGGAHEALVKSSKRALEAILDREEKSHRHLREHELRLVLAEVTGFLNSRPLDYEDGNPMEPAVLTPNHFLLQRPNLVVPNGQFASRNPRQHFRYVQGLVDLIWQRWTNEYLPTLLSRGKWATICRDLKVGDLVMVVEANIPRGQWLVGTVSEVHKGADKLVRAATIQMPGGESKQRPITKLCLIKKVEDVRNWPQKEEEEEDA